MHGNIYRTQCILVLYREYTADFLKYLNLVTKSFKKYYEFIMLIVYYIIGLFFSIGGNE